MVKGGGRTELRPTQFVCLFVCLWNQVSLIVCLWNQDCANKVVLRSTGAGRKGQEGAAGSINQEPTTRTTETLGVGTKRTNNLLHAFDAANTLCTPVPVPPSFSGGGSSLLLGLAAFACGCDADCGHCFVFRRNHNQVEEVRKHSERILCSTFSAITAAFGNLLVHGIDPTKDAVQQTSLVLAPKLAHIPGETQGRGGGGGVGDACVCMCVRACVCA